VLEHCDMTGGYVTNDGGESWRMFNLMAGLSTFAFDSRNPSVIYAGNAALWRSEDKGRSWSMVFPDPTKQTVEHTWSDHAEYVITTNDSTYPASGEEIKSTNGAESWEKMTLPAGTNGPTSLVLDPSIERRMYLTAWGVARLAGDTGGGVFVSTNGGQTWKNIFNASQHVYDLTLDSKHPNLLYICGFDGAAYRSADSGTTWSRIKGYNFKWGHRVILDPVDEKSIYITTFGGSVWHGPASGDPLAKEDILTPPRN
jgi:photosystem II stability/assembly factor-like uncharacterized protein